MNIKIGCVLMAAGNASRFGDNKLDKELFGKSLIDRALECLRGQDFYKVCVVSQYNEIMDKAEKLGFCAIKNEHPDFGISHTIKLGINALSECDAIMFMVSDQPLLRKESVEAMVEFYKENSNFIVGMGYGGVRGNPCIFPREFFSELLKLREDHGGNTVIRQHEDRLKLFEATHPDELSDIDTKEELRALSK